MSRHHRLFTTILLITLEGLGLKSGMAPAVPTGGQNPSPPAVQNTPVVIKTETNVVLVDVTVTDKKGNYIEDLTEKDFHVIQDGTEQTISAFSREADTEASAPDHERYMVLLFDDSSNDPSLKMAGREAAGRFVEGAASPQRLMAVVDFSRGLKVAQNFTASGEMLKRAVTTVKTDSVQPNNESLDSGLKAMGGPLLYRTAPDMNASTPLLAIRDVAHWLRAFPGRKTLILFSAGFVFSSERQPELTAALDALNRANIAVYPVEVHGLASSANSSADCTQTSRMGGNPCLAQTLISNVTDQGSTNQEILNALAKGTGGFEILNNSDFLQGLQKVSKDANEYYNLGYTPPNQTHDGSYHKISVKVDRPGVIVRNRAGYYDVKSPDLLKGRPEGQVLEARALSQEAGEIPISLSVPYFYVQPGVARVNLALSIPGSSIEFAKQNGVLHADVNVLGIAYFEDGSIAARFSDTVKLDYPKKDLKDFAKSPFDYQNTFRIAPGSYTLKVVVSAGGEKFGKYVVPLVVEPFSGSNLSLAGPAIGSQFLPVSQLTANNDTALMEGRTPLVFKGMELVPSTNHRFAKSAPPVAYVEVYDPVLKNPAPPNVGVMFIIIDRKTNQPVFSSNTILINEYSQPGNPLVPVGIRLPVGQLPAGNYRLEIKGRDALGNVSTVRSADFSIE